MYIYNINIYNINKTAYEKDYQDSLALHLQAHHRDAYTTLGLAPETFEAANKQKEMKDVY